MDLVLSDNTAVVMGVTHTCDRVPNRKSKDHNGALRGQIVSLVLFHFSSGSVCPCVSLSFSLPRPSLLPVHSIYRVHEARLGWLGAQSSRRAAVFGDSQQLVLSTTAGSGTVF